MYSEKSSIHRCPWPSNDPLMIHYHDHEWGVPVHDDKEMFGFIILDGFQAGLSWKTILYKRDNFRKAFDDFDFTKIARYNTEKVESLLQDGGIIRNRLKIESTIRNAQATIDLIEKIGGLSEYIWSFTEGKTIINHWTELGQVPPSSPVSDNMSRELKKKGFNFVGSTICYAFMQAAGLVNDHLVSCFRYKELNNF